MAEILPLLEHDPVPVVPSRRSGRKELGQEHADMLERLEKELPVKAWTQERRKIRFAHYCGVVSLGNLSIEILPKIYGLEADDTGPSRNALIQMLTTARRLRLHRAGPAEIKLQKRSLLDVFILDFCERLRSQLIRGMIRKYVKRRRNLNVLRGKLLIEQQLKLNLAHRERLFCQYDELSEDNVYNQILKHVLAILLKAAAGNRAFREVSEILMRFDLIRISSSANASAAFDSLSFDRLTDRYKPIFEQCGYFLKGFYPDVSAGRKPCLSLLFDMNELFEAYVGSELRKKAQSHGLRVKEQKPQKYFARRMDSGEPVFLMKPDFSFTRRHDGAVVCIADAKWKILDEKEKKLKIAQADLYQMGSYASRYKVNSLVLFYPMQKDLTTPVSLTLEGSGTKLLVFPIDISERKTHSPDLARAILSFL